MVQLKIIRNQDSAAKNNKQWESVLRIYMFLGLPDPDPDPLVRGMDPDPDPAVDLYHHAKIVRKTLILLLFLTFYLWKMM